MVRTPTRFSWRWIHSRVRSARWVGAGIELTVPSQMSKVLPVGNPAALRRARIEDAWRPGELLGQQCAYCFGRFPALCLGGGQQVRCCGAHVRQAQGAEQVDDLVDRRWVHRSSPRRPQAAVPGCSECTSSARRRCPGGFVTRIEARSPSAKRPEHRGRDRAPNQR